MAPSSLIHSTVPVICTDDIDRSLSYYIDILGFSFDFKYGDSPVYAGVKSGDAEIYFTYSPDLTHLIKQKGLAPDIFIWVENASLLFKEHLDKGAEVIEQIADRPWLARQYVIKEINGWHLKFAQPL